MDRKEGVGRRRIDSMAMAVRDRQEQIKSSWRLRTVCKGRGRRARQTGAASGRRLEAESGIQRTWVTDLAARSSSTGESIRACQCLEGEWPETKVHHHLLTSTSTPPHVWRARAEIKMAMVTVCGYPCSGKSTRAQQLAAFFERKLADPSTPTHLKPRRVVIVNDEGLSISKHAYDDARAEKPARAALFSAVQRSLAKEAIVIVDAMNYIKGSRYQMYCEAREVGVRTCTVFVATPPDQCRERNAARPDSTAYAPATLDNLISRFEEPQSAARWDAPLFTIATDDPPFDEPAATATQEGGDSVPLGSTEAERIWTAITEGVIKPSTVATQQATTSSTSYLTRLDSSSSALISSLLSLQSISPLSGPTTLSVPLSSSSSSSSTTATTAATKKKNAESTTIRVTVDLNRPVTLPMLQRLKRQFIQLNARTASATEFGEREIVSLFAQYVGEQTR